MVLQFALQRTRTHVQVARDFLNRGAAPSQLSLNCAKNKFDKISLPVRVTPFGLCFKLRCEHLENLVISCNERSVRIFRPEHQCVSGCSANYGTSEVLLKCFEVCARLNQFHSKGRDVPLGPAPCDREQPCETKIDKSWRFSSCRKSPAELHAPLPKSLFLENFFRSRELFISGDVPGRIAKRLCR